MQATLGNVLAISVVIAAGALALASSVVFNWSLATVVILAITMTLARLGY